MYEIKKKLRIMYMYEIKKKFINGYIIVLDK